ncbi:uncharacterized protein LOC133711495 [Rosa rugosa]|uniref:uncharacterized protein LOC133711495 n=1 Tax=Rosa rugosa TaxID=74645 RepID=UPI002B40C0F2|nr:uncharacterized protein LOC133711495 [Rosa rugosa]
MHRLEDSLHLFCKCPIALEVLSDSSLQLQHTLLTATNFKDWLLECVMHLGLEVFAKLMMQLWMLWKNRNNLLWNNKSQNSQSLSLQALTWLEEFKKARSTHGAGQPPPKPTWQPAEDNNPQLNVDGAFVPQLARGGTGGVLRDSQGRFMAAFAHAVPHTSSAKQTELMAIKQGLAFVKGLNLQQVTIESDCLDAVQLILKKDHELDELGALVDDILHQLLSLPQVRIQHAKRTCNAIAHKLAAYAFDSVLSNMVWTNRLPECISDVLQYDSAHIA